MGSNHKIKKKYFFQKYILSGMIKEALDNLPSGICYFNKKGIPLLINKTMHRLMYQLTGKDIQNISDFDKILSCEKEFTIDDGTVWQFHKNNTGENRQYTEIIASDITELYYKRRELENTTNEQQNVMLRLEEISRNVISITRNEEILAMKMRIHNELGFALAETRQFIASNCDADKKTEYIDNHRKVSKKLLGEIGKDDEIDIFSELMTNAEKLGTRIILEGDLPDCFEEIMTQVIRECLVNTIQHGKGDTVFVKTTKIEEVFTAVITNNGKPPGSKIIEGGGLLSIRKNIESMGGTVTINYEPEFAVIIKLLTQLPKKENGI